MTKTIFTCALSLITFATTLPLHADDAILKDCQKVQKVMTAGGVISNAVCQDAQRFCKVWGLKNKGGDTNNPYANDITWFKKMVQQRNALCLYTYAAELSPGDRGNVSSVFQNGMY